MSDLVQSLFRNPEDLPERLSEKQLEEKRRYEATITWMLDHPAASDHALRDHIMQLFGLSHSQAYRDIAAIKKLIGNYPNAAKEWHRHVTISMLLKSYDMAEKANDVKNMIAAADKYGKYTRLDKIDPENFDWKKMVPPSFEPSPDVSLLKINNPADVEQRKSKLMRQYLSEADDVVDVEPIE